MTWPRRTKPSLCRMPAICSATVVLPVPGLPVNDMCRVGNVGRQRHLLPDALDQQQRRDLTNAGLHGLQADQFGIELVEHLADAEVGEFGPEIDGLGGGIGADSRLFLNARRVTHRLSR